MKNIIAISLFLFILLTSFNLSAQRRGGQGKHNMFGLKVGATYFDIKTSNFITTPEYGFMGGFATRGDFYNNWDIQFGITISNNKLNIQGRETAITAPENVELGLLNAQVQLLFGYKIIGNNRRAQSNFKVTAEFGPVLMVNSKMKIAEKNQEEYLIDNTNLTATQLTDISGININGLAGLSLGIEHFRVFGHYQYGFNNILNKLNKIEGTTENFKGHIALFQFGVLFYF